MKLYTKRGDDGLTDLLGGGRVPKDSPRMEVIGQVDELNGALGWVVSADTGTELGEILTRVQSRLFEIGAELAVAQSSGSRSAQSAAGESRFGPDEIDELERHIDAACAPVPPIKQFILPGGTEIASRLHLARAICRRAERSAVALNKIEPVPRQTLVFLNRLSDLLFALARLANHIAAVDEVPWRSGREGGPERGKRARSEGGG